MKKLFAFALAVMMLAAVAYAATAVASPVYQADVKPGDSINIDKDGVDNDKVDVTVPSVTVPDPVEPEETPDETPAEPAPDPEPTPEPERKKTWMARAPSARVGSLNWTPTGPRRTLPPAAVLRSPRAIPAAAPSPFLLADAPVEPVKPRFSIAKLLEILKFLKRLQNVTKTLAISYSM